MKSTPEYQVTLTDDDGVRIGVIKSLAIRETADNDKDLFHKLSLAVASHIGHDRFTLRWPPD